MSCNQRHKQIHTYTQTHSLIATYKLTLEQTSGSGEYILQIAKVKDVANMSLNDQVLAIAMWW